MPTADLYGRLEWKMREGGKPKSIHFPPWQTAYQFSLGPVARHGVDIFHSGRPHINSAGVQYQGVVLVFSTVVDRKPIQPGSSGKAWR
jgi:hypothetical protein